jgi:hypothetical protein
MTLKHEGNNVRELIGTRAFRADCVQERQAIALRLFTLI